MGADIDIGAVAGRLLDPLNVTGMADQTSSKPKPVGGNLDPTLASAAANAGMAPMQPKPERGYLAGMIPRADANNFFTGAPRALPPPPPSSWAYEPGKGASWSAPHRKGTTTEYEYSSAAPGSAEFNSFKGNRI